MDSKDLQDRPIPGITARQIAAAVGALFTLAFLYFDIRNEIQTNRQETLITRDLINEMKSDYKEEREFRRAEMAAIRAELRQIAETQRSFDLRLTVMETIIKK